jgi:hypothetical protein
MRERGGGDREGEWRHGRSNSQHTTQFSEKNAKGKSKSDESKYRDVTKEICELLK